MALTDSSHEAVFTCPDNTSNKKSNKKTIIVISHEATQPEIFYEIWYLRTSILDFSLDVVFCILRCFVLVTADLSHIILFVTVKHAVCPLM